MGPSADEGMRRARRRCLYTVKGFRSQFLSATFCSCTMASVIPLCLALIKASIVSALFIDVPGQIQQPGSGSEHVPTSSRETPANGRTSNSGLSLQANGVLQPGHNGSLSTLNVSAPTFFNCDEGWGRSLNLQMCGEAVAFIPRTFKTGSTPMSFGPREAGSFDIGLPKRWMSCEFSFSTTGKGVTALIFEQLMGFAPSSRSSYQKRNPRGWRRGMRTLPLLL